MKIRCDGWVCCFYCDFGDLGDLGDPDDPGDLGDLVDLDRNESLNYFLDYCKNLFDVKQKKYIIKTVIECGKRCQIYLLG